MTWYLVNKNGIWEMNSGAKSRRIKALPSKSPISAKDLSPHNILVDFDKEDPETEIPKSSEPKRSKAALDLIIKWEGYHRSLPSGDCESYADPGHGWSVPTIGYGTTTYRAAGLAKYNRSAVQRGDTLTQVQAADELNAELEKIERSLVGYLVAPVTQDMFDALCSFCYNLGMSGASKQIARVNAGLYEECAASFDLYVNANGRPLQGLINRRNDEEALFRSQGLNPKSSSIEQPPLPALLTRTKKRVGGFEELKLDFAGKSYSVRSGLASAQSFRKPTDPRSRPGNMEPIPQGLYDIGAPEWADGAYNFSASWGLGLGPVWVPLTAKFSDDRGAFGIHLDAGQPGSAGCVVFPELAELKEFIQDLSATKGVTLFVDWGLA